MRPASARPEAERNDHAPCHAVQRLAFLDRAGDADVGAGEEGLGRFLILGQLLQVTAEAGRGFGGKWAVDDDRYGRQASAFDQKVKVVQQFLRAFDRKGRDQQIAARREGSEHLGAKPLPPLPRREIFAIAIAVGGLQHQPVRIMRGLGVGDERLRSWPDVAGDEEMAPTRQDELD